MFEELIADVWDYVCMRASLDRWLDSGKISEKQHRVMVNLIESAYPEYAITEEAA